MKIIIFYTFFRYTIKILFIMEGYVLKKTTQKGISYLLALALTMFMSACSTKDDKNITDDKNTTNEESLLVKSTPIDDINASTMLVYINAFDPNATNAYGYKAVKITYKTVGQDDSSVVASGLLTIPTGMRTPSMICDNHGTIFRDSEAPTNVEISSGTPDIKLAIVMTSYAGFIGIYPDYIGFGDSNGIVHPYILKKAAARGSVDMIKASMEYMTKNNISFDKKLYISGYSEGGYNAMATAQSIEEGSLSDVTLMGVAPMAGPYNVKDLADIELSTTHTMANPAFLADLAYSYAYYYDDVNLSKITIPTFDKFQRAFDGINGSVQIHTILGLADIKNGDYGLMRHTAAELFKSKFITDYQNNANNLMVQKFEENNLDDWTPKSKMNFIQCLEDDIIPFSESNNTYNKFKSAGADVSIVKIHTDQLRQQRDDAHPFVHSNCGEEAYTAAVQWFSAIRSGTVK